MRKYRGATLIEVLISVLVLAVGLLGLSATQMMSLKNGNGAHQRYMASLAAEEILERMRANPLGVEKGHYDGTVDGSESPVGCSAGCSVTELARLDLYEWGRVISSNLPGGEGEVERSGGAVTVTVSWKEPRADETDGGGGVQAAAFAMSVEL